MLPRVSRDDFDILRAWADVTGTGVLYRQGESLDLARFLLLHTEIRRL